MKKPKSSQNYPVEIIRIRLSTPILTRTKCKKCNSNPTLYYYTYGGMPGWSPSRPQTIMHKNKFRMGLKLVSRDTTRDMTQMSYLGQASKFKSYAPTYHRVHGDEPGAEYDYDIIEYLTCECGSSRWIFAEKSIQHRPEIINRKARDYFPLKILY